MDEKIFIYFIGTAGSGKTTLTSSFKSWLELKSLNVITVNLDPGAENLSYVPDVDIRDWISLKEIMESYDLGPNGAQIACADMIAINSEDIKKSINSFQANYVLIDTPGQLELFVFRQSGKYIINFLDKNHSIIAYLIDYLLAKNASGFISQMLLSLNTNFRLKVPQINILSKSDLLNEKEKEKIKYWSEDINALRYAIESEEPSVYREINEKILQVLSDFDNNTKLKAVGKDYYGIDDLYTAIQIQFHGGEDLLKD
ncbi:ATP/GTP-binding protein [Thermoplasmatota archaeon]